MVHFRARFPSAERAGTLGPALLLHAAVPVACVVIFAVISARAWFQNDDAFISYRYAANLAAGRGLVFNPGEYVEGFTNLLWTLLIAAFIKAGGTAPKIAVYLSAIFGSLSLIGSALLCRALLPARTRILASLAPVVVLLTGAFTYWNVSGLEVPMTTALVTWACWAGVTRRAWPTLLLCILAALSRPDAALLAVCLLGLPAVSFQIGERDVRSRAGALLPSFLFALACLLLVAWRFHYYRDIVPNTFHAKVGQIAASRGLLYIASFLADGAGWLIPGAALAAISVHSLRYALSFVLLYSAYVWSIGGDVYPFGRFLLPLIPILVAGNIAVLGADGTGRLQRWAVALCMCLTVLFSQAVAAPSWSLDRQIVALRTGWLDFAKHPPIPDAGTGFVSDKYVMDLVAKFRQLVPGLKVIAAPGIGRLGYDAMDVRIIDILGLADRQVTKSNITLPASIQLPGHTRTDARYVLAQRPDVINIGPFAGYCPPGSPKPIIPAASTYIGRIQIPAVMELWQNPDLPRHYVFRTDAGAWFRRDLLPPVPDVPCAGTAPAAK